MTKKTKQLSYHFIIYFCFYSNDNSFSIMDMLCSFKLFSSLAVRLREDMCLFRQANVTESTVVKKKGGTLFLKC